MTQRGQGEPLDRRRRASSNYFELDADRRRNQSERSARFSTRLTSMDMAPLAPGKGVAQDDEVAIDYCCDVLKAKFGFQDGSVSNQREHALLLLANGRARHLTPNDHATEAHVVHLAETLLSNYRSWCAFLDTEPRTYTGTDVPTASPPQGHYYMDMLLYLLIWGEAANVRHMPECLCYLYHQLVHGLNADPHAQDTHPDGWYLHHVITPLWRAASAMQRRNAAGHALEHVHVRNYDDLNEFFWTRACLAVDVVDVGDHVQTHHGKTFYEHRSLLTLVLHYYRIFQFNGVFFVALVVLAFAVTISPAGGARGWRQFQALGSVVDPYTSRDLTLALVALPLSFSALASLKCLLEVGHAWHVLVATRRTSWPYALALTLRGAWHGTFAAVFASMLHVPLTHGRETPLLDQLHVLAAAYVLPGTLLLLVQVVAPSLLRRTWAAHFVREGASCYVGHDMTPPRVYRLQYTAFWLVLWLVQGVTSYFLLIRPLMLPSVAIYAMHLSYTNALVSFHNVGVLLALWLPVVCVFLYAPQIFFTILQALVGGVQGWWMQTGEVRGIKDMTKAFRVAPQLFDQKVVTLRARANDAPRSGRTSAAAYESQMMLRFVVVWNEIVNSFREGDLVDDKEAAILQYDIRSTGEVFEPVFLSAGKVTDALQLTLKLHKNGKSESQVRVALVAADCVSALRSFFTASLYVLEVLCGTDDADVLEALRTMEAMAARGDLLASCRVDELPHVRAAALDVLEEILDLPEPDVPSPHLGDHTVVHALGVVRNFVAKMETLLTALQRLCTDARVARAFASTHFCTQSAGFVYASHGLVNLCRSDTAMGAATRACLLLSLDRSEAMPRTSEAQRRLGFFMKSLVMDMPSLGSIKEMRSFSVVTPFYAETVLFSLQELNDPLVNHPIFQHVEEEDKKVTILKYLTTIHEEEWENFLERLDVSSAAEAQAQHPDAIRLWASYRGQTLARTVQGMMLYEEAIKILHWLEIGASVGKTAAQKQAQLQDMVRLKFSYVCACQVYGRHRAEQKAQAADIDYLLREYPNLRVAYVDTLPHEDGTHVYDSVLIKSEGGEIVEVYRYALPGDPILGEGKPENQNHALAFTRGEFVQTIDMNQQHYFEECLKMPQLLCTAERHVSNKPVSIIGMREHIFTGNASSLARFKTWQELVFVTLSQRVLANPLCVRMHYGHPDVFDKVLAMTRGGVSKASKGINLSEDVFAGFNTTLRGGVVTHVEFLQCGKGRDVALSQISMFEGKLANGAGETSLAREAHRLGQFLDFCRLNSLFYSHTGFYFATWMTIVTTFVYMYCKVYLALTGVQTQIVEAMNTTDVIRRNAWRYGFDTRVLDDMDAVYNTQYYIQAGLFLSLPLVCIYFAEMGFRRGLVQFLDMLCTAGPAFFVFQLGTSMHFFDHNLLHGEAQYKATGRGFKITRETFVLLYKAYASSHVRKAMELMGLCLVYGTFGSFAICDLSVAGQANDFAFAYCTTAQSFGVQTFAIWVISVVWLLSPYLFNTDGLDWQKTKADVAAWCRWMYAPRAYVDDDAVMTGGWIAWWQSELEVYHNTRPIARVTVVVRECRHFVLMWYVVALEWEFWTIGVVVGAAVGTLGVLGVANRVSRCVHVRAPSVRAAVYLAVVVTLVVVFFCTTMLVWQQSLQATMALFFGYFAALYGLNEMARMYSFAHASIATVGAFQHLAFLFDFVFSVVMLVPLVLLSALPFLNIVQTRMMYNKGFSDVVSASSQYAFSLAAVMGGVGGVGCGWLFHLFTTLESTAGFLSYVTTFDLLRGQVGTGVVTYAFYLAAVGGCIGAGGVSYCIGRRLTIVAGGLAAVVGMLCVSCVPSSGGGFLFPGICALGVSVGTLVPTLAVYIYEISTREMRGKALLLLGSGFIGGMGVAAYCSSSAKDVGWGWQVFVATVLVSVLTPAVYLFPESPSWVYMRQGLEACERCLTVLRRKEGVTDELHVLQKEDEGATWTLVKLSLGLVLMLVSGLWCGCMNMYVSDTLRAVDAASYMFVNCVSLQLVGALLSFLFLDRIPHQRIVLWTMVVVGTLVAVLGVSAQTMFVTGTARAVLLETVGLVVYFFAGLGLSAVPWVTCVGLFGTTQRAVYVPLAFALFFLMPVVSTYVRAQRANYAYMYLYALTALCLVTMMLLLCVGTRKNGMICTKREMEAERECLRRLRASRRSARTPGSARSKNFSRSRAKSHSNYQMYESPAASCP